MKIGMISKGDTVRALHSAPDYEGPVGPSESLAAIRGAARRERLIDMELRLRRYRLGTFAILAVGLVLLAPELGWWWLAPLALGLAGFAVADRFVRSSSRPAVWIACAWGMTPILLATAVVATEGATSPVLMWFALPAVTLGARFEPRGIAIGTVYLFALMMLSGCILDPSGFDESRKYVFAAVTMMLSTVILSGALVESDRAHRRRSTVDPLTGLFNRNALEARLAELDEEASAEPGNPHSLLLCDLDHFKHVNDRLGHSAGDAVLQEVAYTMRGSLRAGDSIFRIGGEEILVVLPGAARDDAVDIAERLRTAVRDLRPMGVEVTLSIGAAVAAPGQLDSDELIRRADAALYSAKANGRDMVVVGTEERAAPND